MWRRVVAMVSSRSYVGLDKCGNRYYIEPLTNPEGERWGRKELRMVEYSNEPDPKSLPRLWQSWLNYRRETPPSDEDIEFYDQQMISLKKRVAELESEDTKLRLQEIAAREGAGGFQTDGPQQHSATFLLTAMQRVEGSDPTSYKEVRFVFFPTTHRKSLQQDDSIFNGMPDYVPGDGAWGPSDGKK